MSLVYIKLPVESNAVCVEVPDKAFRSDNMIEFTLLLNTNNMPLDKGYCCVTLLDDEGNAIDRAENTRTDLNIDFEFTLTAETSFGTYRFGVLVVGPFWYIDVY